MTSSNCVYDYPAHFRKIVGDMASLYEKKNADYGNSFAESVDKFGLVAGAVRISDKLNRLSTLIDHKQKVNDESLYDTCIDGACYFIMLAMEVERRQLAEQPNASCANNWYDHLKEGEYP